MDILGTYLVAEYAFPQLRNRQVATLFVPRKKYDFLDINPATFRNVLISGERNSPTPAKSMARAMSATAVTGVVATTATVGLPVRDWLPGPVSWSGRVVPGSREVIDGLLFDVGKSII